jgi:exonuclease SbcC
MDGEKCPVCGSVNHPSPAVLTERAPTEAELNKAKDLYEKAQQYVSRLSADAGTLKGTANAKLEEIKKQSNELIGTFESKTIKSEIENALKELRDNLLELNKKLAKENENISRKTNLEKFIPEKEKESKDIADKINNLGITVSAIETEIKNIREQSGRLSEILEFDSKDKAVTAINALETRKIIMQKALENAQKSYSDCKSTVDELIGKITALLNQLKNTELIDTSVIKQEKISVESKKSKVALAITEVTGRIKSNSSVLGNIIKQSGNLTEVEAKWTWVKSLSNTANGNISGKEKIKLETYIQMTFFDRIIAKANTRFMVMSGGQYELKRRIEAENKQIQSGLELDVIDHYNGTERSVKTLSGGESFKASLSLALGLSDEIQSSAGGIQLDTMFVDEGFGSLDEESLQQAIRALAGLTEGNRLVGIISHVAELKEKIDKQIIVTKDKSGGSFVRVIV